MKNVVQGFFDKASELGDSVCVRYKRDNLWETMSWDELSALIKRTAAALREMGVGDGDRVAIFAGTSIEWTVADMSILAAGGVTVPIYQSLTKNSLAQIILDSRPKIAIIWDDWMGKTFKEALYRADIKGDLPIIYMNRSDGTRELFEIGDGSSTEEIAEIERITSGIDGDADATVVYTSGTTGEQKGALLTHENLMGETDGAIEAFRFGQDDIGLLCLPLAHVLGRMMQFYALVGGTQLAYAESIQKLAQSYMEVRPHYVVAVPRMLEKIYDAVMKHIEGASFPTQFFARWALRVGEARSRYLMKHRKPPILLKLVSMLASRTVFQKFRKRLGGRLTHCICGGAYLPVNVAQFFHATGTIIMEGYGLTETFAAVTVNRADDFRFGSVGKPFIGTEIKISESGEILIKGRTVFKEYLNKPEATAASFEGNGWFKSGDIGEFSRDGFLRITGRIKDIIVTAGGKNVPPQMVESLMLKTPFIDHFVVCGDGRRYLTALLTLNRDAVDKFLRREGFSDVKLEDFAEHPRVRRLIADHIDEQNRFLARFETIKRFAILGDDLSLEGGMLTPTFKIRRKAITEKYAKMIEGLYLD